MRVAGSGAISRKQDNPSQGERRMDQGGKKVNAEDEDVFESTTSLKRLRRGVSMPNLQASTPASLPRFDDFIDALPKAMFEKFGSPYWQNLFFSKNPEVQLALRMLMNPSHWSKAQLQTQFAKAGLDSLLDYVLFHA